MLSLRIGERTYNRLEVYYLLTNRPIREIVKDSIIKYLDSKTIWDEVI